MELNSPKETNSLAKRISKILKNGDVVFLHGEIGVGKTTFVRFVINHLQVENKIKKSNILSPTFNIVYDYDVGKLKILHYDLYRIKNCKDILQLGIFEASNNHIKIIEWPELIKPKPKNRIDILFSYSKLMNSREVKIFGFGKWKDYKFNGI
jgi:tRNA threonylcarbamoyl adenosine modification protein YjeE